MGQGGRSGAADEHLGQGHGCARGQRRGVEEVILAQRPEDEVRVGGFWRCRGSIRSHARRRSSEPSLP